MSKNRFNGAINVRNNRNIERPNGQEQSSPVKAGYSEHSNNNSERGGK